MTNRRNIFSRFFRLLVMLHKISYAHFTEWNNKRKRKAFAAGIYFLSILPEFVLLAGTFLAARGQDGYVHLVNVPQKVVFYGLASLAVLLSAIPLGFFDDKKICKEVRQELRERPRYWKRAIAVYWAVIFVLYYAKMRDLKMALGDYRSAEEYGREYLILSSDRRDAAFFEPWVTQGLIYARLKNLKSFTECFDVILGLILKKDPAPRMLAMVYKARGLGYSLFEDWKKAYEDFSEAGKILAQYGAGDDELLDNLSSQGMVLTKMKKYKEARKAYRRCAEAYRAKYGKESSQYQETLARLGTVELYLGNKDEGCRLYGQAAQWLQNMVKSQLRYVNSAERGSFWNVAMEKLWTMPFFALQAEATDNAFTEASYNALLFSKSLLLETEKSLQKAIQTEGSPEDLEKFTGRKLSAVFGVFREGKFL